MSFSLVAVMLGSLFVYVAYTIHRHHLDALNKRIVDKHNVVWDVQINGVKAGTILDAEWATIARRSLANADLYIAQAVNVARALINMVSSCLRLVP